MQAFLAILRFDLLQLAHSWLLRLWVALLVAPAIFLVIVAANESELASETLSAYMAAVLVPLSLLAVAIMSSSAISGEASTIADAVLSRSVTRTEYLSAKIASRVSISLAVYLLVTIPFCYLVIRYAVSDTSASGVTLAVLTLAVMLAFVTTFGIALSTLVRNIQLAVLILLVTVLLSGAVLQFLGLTWMSTTYVVNQLPETFRGETPFWHEFRVLFIFSLLTAGAVFSSIWTFRATDL